MDIGILWLREEAFLWESTKILQIIWVLVKKEAWEALAQSQEAPQRFGKERSERKEKENKKTIHCWLLFWPLWLLFWPLWPLHNNRCDHYGLLLSLFFLDHDRYIENNITA